MDCDLVLHAVEYRKNANLVALYLHYSIVLKYDNIQFAMQLQQISKFETLNKVSINLREDWKA